MRFVFGQEGSLNLYLMHPLCFRLQSDPLNKNEGVACFVYNDRVLKDPPPGFRFVNATSKEFVPFSLEGYAKFVRGVDYCLVHDRQIIADMESFGTFLQCTLNPNIFRVEKNHM